MPTRSTPTALASRKPSPEWERAATKASASFGGQANPRPPIFGAPTDNISRLPSNAATKLHALRQEVEELRTLIAAGVDRQQDIIQDRQSAKARLDILTDPAVSQRHGDGFVYAADHNAVVQARGEFAKFSDQLEQLQALQKTRQTKFNALGGLLRNVETFLSSASDIVPFDADPVEATGEQPALAVERMRKRRRELLADLREVETAPTLSRVLKEGVRREVEQIAERGRLNVHRMVESGNPSLRFPSQSTDVEINGFVPGLEGAPWIVARGHVPIPDANAFTVWLHKDAVLKKLLAEIDAAANDDEALSDEERAARLADIHSEILAVERVEEQFTELAGSAVTRRADLNPRAFLGIQ